MTKELYDEALSLADAGQHEEALACLQEYLTQAPNDGTALNDAGTILYALGRFDQAIAHLQMSMAKLGSDPQAIWNLCEVYVAAQRPAEAMRLFPEMGKAALLSPDLANRVANQFVQQGQLAAAVECLLLSLELCPQQDILLPMLQNIRTHRPKVAFFCDTDQTNFWGDIIGHVSARFETRICRDYSRAGFASMLEWCDIAWFEWCTNQVIAASHMSKTFKSVVRLHRYEAYGDWLDQINWNNIDVLVTIGNSFLQEYLHSRLPGLRKSTSVVAMPNGVDLGRFALVERPRGKNLAAVAYLKLLKNPMMLLQCFQRLHAIDPQYKLFFAGDFYDVALEQYMRHMVGELALEGSVFFEGHQTDMPAWLADKHYLLSASISESQGMNIFEAMASGIRPVIHNFPGADSLLPREYLYNTADDFCRQILQESYEPAKYRQYVADHYSLATQMASVSRLFDGLEKQIVADRSGRPDKLNLVP